MGRTRARQATADQRRGAALSVEFDAAALFLINAASDGEYLDLSFGTNAARTGLLLMVSPTVPPAGTLMVFGEPGGVLRAHSRTVPDAVSAIALACGEVTGRRVRCAFPWPPGLPRATAAVLGYGLASQVRALIRHAEPDRLRRPVIHLEDCPA